jgi:hypothetical protein
MPHSTPLVIANLYAVMVCYLTLFVKDVY